MALVVRTWGYPEHPRFAGLVVPSRNCRASAGQAGVWEEAARQARHVQAIQTGVTLIYAVAKAILLVTTLWAWGMVLRRMFESMNASMANGRARALGKDAMEE